MLMTTWYKYINSIVFNKFKKINGFKVQLKDGVLQSFLISRPTSYSSHYVRLEKLVLSTVHLACFFDLRFIAI